MRRFVVLAAGVASVSSGALCKQTQDQAQASGSQYQTQNDGSTYQSQYQVNGVNGAGQGQGVGGDQASADYAASASLRGATPYPQGSYQEQNQTLSAGGSVQTSTTRPPASRGGGAVPQ